MQQKVAVSFKIYTCLHAYECFLAVGTEGPDTNTITWLRVEVLSVSASYGSKVLCKSKDEGSIAYWHVKY